MMPNKRSGFRLVQEEEDRSQCTGGGEVAGTEEASGAFKRKVQVEEDRSQCTGGGVDAGTAEASGAFERKI